MTLAIGIELGGTKTVVAGSTSGSDLIGRTRVETSDPVTTLAAIRNAIDAIAVGRPIGSIGIGSFGPVDLRPGSPTRGTIISTPKPDWSGVDILGGIGSQRVAAVAIDTDVNAALLGEAIHGSVGTKAAAYLTVGTGIGAGLWLDGSLVHGANHPEIGHLPVPRRAGDEFLGLCPYHGDCLEGMASGPALAARFGGSLEGLGTDERLAAAELAAHYVGCGVFTIATVAAVETVVVGGGVSHLPGFHEAVGSTANERANRYPPVPFASGGLTVVPPDLGDDAGVIGSIELGRAESAAL